MNNKREDTLNKVQFTQIIIGIIILIPSIIFAFIVVFGEIENYYIFIIKILFFLCLIGIGGNLIIKGTTLASEIAERKQELEIVKIKQEEKKKPESRMQEEKRQPEGKAMEIDGGRIYA